MNTTLTSTHHASPQTLATGLGDADLETAEEPPDSGIQFHERCSLTECAVDVPLLPLSDKQNEHLAPKQNDASNRSWHCLAISSIGLNLLLVLCVSSLWQ